MKYVFSEPIREGILDNKPFFVVEVSEFEKGLGVVRKSKINLEHLDLIVKSIFKEVV